MKKVALFYILLLVSSLSLAEDNLDSNKKKGLDISVRLKDSDSGWVDSTSNMQMLLKFSNGRSAKRDMKVKNLEVESDGDKSLMTFVSPKDVSGTSFLTYSHVSKEDDQWMYLPSFKRIKRISSKNKSGSFMGSEFSYEDLSSFEVSKYDFLYIGEETYQKEKCYIVESYPKNKFSGYSKLVSWINIEKMRTEKVEYYDKDGALLKILSVKKFSKLNEKFWRPVVSIMENKQSGNVTEMYWTNIKLKTGLVQSDFSKNALKRSF